MTLVVHAMALTLQEILLAFHLLGSLAKLLHEYCQNIAAFMHILLT